MRINGRAIYKGSGKPVNLYQGHNKIAGWVDQSQSGLDLPFESTYNDGVGLLAQGRSYQDSKYYREASGSNILSIQQHAKNVLDKCLVDMVAQQTVTVQGKNLVDHAKPAAILNQVTILSLPTGIRAIAASDSSGWLWAYIDIGPISTYAGKAVTLSASIVASGVNTGRCVLAISSDDYATRNAILSITSSGFVSGTLAASYPGYTRVLIGVFANYNSGTAGVGDYVDYANLQLELGSVATAYAPFVPDSPSPDYPAPINGHSALNVYRRGKNLFNPSLYDGLNKYSVNPTYIRAYNNAAYWLAPAVTFIVNPNTSYALSYDRLFGGNATSDYTHVQNAITGVNISYGTGNTNERKTILFNSGSANRILIRFQRLGGGDNLLGWIDVSNVQLEPGAVATPYEPYNGLDYALPLQATAYGLTGAPDSRDQNGLEVHRTVRHDVNGSESIWADRTADGAFTNCNWFQVTLPSTFGSDHGISSHFKTFANTISDTEHVRVIPNTGHVGFFVLKSMFPNLTAFKTWIAANPVTIVGRLATPVTYSNPAQQIALADGLNNVFSDYGTLNVGYQVPTGQNVAGDVLSPLPNYPAAIVSAVGDVRVEGRNLLDASKLSRTTGVGITLGYDPINEIVTLNGTSSSAGAVGFVLLYGNSVPLEVGKAYRLTTWVIGGNISGTGNFAVMYLGHGDDVSTRSNWFAVDLKVQTKSAFVTATKKYMNALWVYADPGLTFNNLKFKVQFERDTGAVPSKFTPYRPILTLPIPELFAIPDGVGGWLARDTIELRKVGWVWHRIKVQRVGRRIFTGTETFRFDYYSGMYTVQNTTPANIGGMCTSNRFVGVSSIPASIAGRLGKVVSQPGGTTIHMGFDGTSTADGAVAFKSRIASWYAAGDPLYVDYQLATPIETDLGPIDLPSYYPYTRVLVSGDYPPDMTATVKVVE